MTSLSEKAKNLLFSGEYTFALINGEKTFTSDKRGVAPILGLLGSSPALLKDSGVADKVIGKAAALLLAYGGIKELHTELISEPALGYLSGTGIRVTYDKIVPWIKNRTGEGLCPMEASVMFTENPERAYEILRDLAKKMNPN